MDFKISASTDIGILKNANQDSLSVKVIKANCGRMVFAVLCDGLGGLSKGEVASAMVVRAFEKWAVTKLPVLCNSGINEREIRKQWEDVAVNMNDRIYRYGERHGIKLGTTVVAMLLTSRGYYILNIGDSRAYEITGKCRQLTIDQTLVAREVALGNMTEEQAKVDERRHVLLQCIGASGNLCPDIFFGSTRHNAVYMLCSDGFRHKITSTEILEKLNPKVLHNEGDMDRHAKELIEQNKQRMERDNISVILVRTF